MQGYSVESMVAAICGGAFGLAALMAVLSFVSLLNARSVDAAVERSAAFAIALIAVAIGFAAFWSAQGGPAAMGGSVAQAGAGARQFLESVGIPVAFFQIQAALSAVIVGFLAWRFPHRQ